MSRSSQPEVFLSQDTYEAWLRADEPGEWQRYLRLSYRDYQLADPEPDHWSDDLVHRADAWVAAQLDEEERLAYEQAYAEYEERERARYYAERAVEEELEADRQRWYSIQEPPWA